MSDTTPRLGLPYLAASQAQKHVTHNEALLLLDVFAGVIPALSRSRTTPAGGESDGAVYILGGAGTGAWAGFAAGDIAFLSDGTWSRHAPTQGMLAAIAAEAGALVRWTGAAWSGSDAVALAATIHAATAKPAIIDADEFGFWDSVSGLLRKLSFANLKAALVTYFNTLYVTLAGIAAYPGAVRFNGPFGVGRDGITPGGLYFNRNSDNPFIIMSGGDPAVGVTEVGQVRASVANTVIGFTQSTGGTYFVAVNTSTGRVGIKTTTPSNILSVEGITAPETDNAYTLGTSGKRWSTVYAATGTINTSDAREKDIAGRLTEAAGKIVDAVEPIMFRWMVGGVDVVEIGTEKVLDGYTKVQKVDEVGAPVFTKTGLFKKPEPVMVDEPIYVDVPIVERTPVPGKRLHLGWSAQEIRAALAAQNLDCGAWGLDDASDPESRQWVRPDELTALLWAALRETRTELTDARKRIAAIEGKS